MWDGVMSKDMMVGIVEGVATLAQEGQPEDAMVDVEFQSVSVCVHTAKSSRWRGVPVISLDMPEGLSFPAAPGQVMNQALGLVGCSMK